jgi:PKD repeat protein
MRKRFLLSALLALVLTSPYAQQVKPCAQAHQMDGYFLSHPQDRQLRDDAARILNDRTHQMAADRGSNMTIYTIPVVFHVVHNYGTENISDEQILDGLSILNRDFRKMNPDTVVVVDAFDQLVADIGIEFKLASKDPDGNCTSGITRTVSDLTSVGDQQVKDLIMWPRNKYLNIWIVQDANGAAGYSNLPPNVAGNWGAGTDGIVVRSDYVGSIGTSSSLHSRTLTHETGHWLNLMHTWGDSNDPALAANCDIDDGVDDTPNTMGWTTCNLNGATCGSPLDNVQNYMEYSYCSRMFTLGQADRMRAALTSSVASRNQLITASNLAATGVTNPALCVADFDVDRTIICVGDSVVFNDNSYNAPTTWTWNFGDGETLSGVDPLIHKNPVHYYNTPGTYNVTLTVSNSTGSLIKVKNNMIKVFDAPGQMQVISEGFEVWPNNEIWGIFNQYGDEGFIPTTSAHASGVKSLMLQNANTTIVDGRDELVSIPFDFAGQDSIIISYKWAFAQKTTNTNDRFRISGSSDCGNNWGLLKIHQGVSNLPTAPDMDGNFVPTADQWMQNTIILTNLSYMTDHFQVKFEFVGKGGNNFYLDDINVYTPGGTGVAELDAQMNAFLFPNPSQQEMKLQLEMPNAQEVDIQLMDATGRCVWNQSEIWMNKGENLLSIPQQSAGLYVLRVKNQKGTLVKRAIFK